MASHRYDGKNHVSAYLKYRVVPHELISKIMKDMKEKTPNQFNFAVDVGCGSGQGTIPLSPYFTKVVGTDNSPAQLEMALTNSNPPNVSYRLCSAEELPFATGEADFLMAMSAAHLFDHQKFLLEADRVLKPGGWLAAGCHASIVELEYGDVSDTLNDICKEFHVALLPFQHTCLGLSSANIYVDILNACSYPDKEWNDCVRIKRIMPLNGYISMVQTYTSYQHLLQRHPAEAERLCNDTRNKLLSAMKASSPDTEVTVVVKFFYWLARKPSQI